MQIAKLSTIELNRLLKDMSVIDKAFFEMYSGRISECDDDTIVRFLEDNDSVDSMEGYTHLMDTYIAFEAGIAFANRYKKLDAEFDRLAQAHEASTNNT